MTTLSDGEKLILIMLSEIYKQLEIKAEIDPEFVVNAIYHDQTWGLRWKYGPLLNSDAEDPPQVRETGRILNMYRHITPSFEELPPAEQERVKTEAAPWGEFISFQGFDGNSDRHYSIVGFLVEHLQRFDELKGRSLNSHSSMTLPKYQRMLEKYEPLISSALHQTLSADQLIQILKA